MVEKLVNEKNSILIFGKFSLVLVFIVQIFTISCKRQHSEAKDATYKNAETNYTASLIPDSIISFAIDERTSLFNPQIRFFLDNKNRPYFIVDNNIGNRLIFFDFNTKNRVFEVNYDRAGVNGIGELQGASILSLDSIIVLGTSDEDIYLSDTSGTIKHKYKVKPKSGIDRTPQLRYGITNSCVASNKDIYLFTFPPGLGWPREAEALKESTIVKYNLLEEDWHFINIPYPEVYHQSGHYTFTHFIGDIDRNGEKLIINFPASNYVFVYENGIITKFLGKSDKVENIPPPGRKMATTSEEIDTQILESPAYLFLSYDPYRKVYYRFLLNAQEDISSIGDVLKMYDEKPCSIIILDENFKKIGETVLAENTYHIPDHFIGPKGLYISTNHPDNPNINEDKLAYQLLKLNYYEK